MNSFNNYNTNQNLDELKKKKELPVDKFDMDNKAQIQNSLNKSVNEDIKEQDGVRVMPILDTNRSKNNNPEVGGEDKKSGGQSFNHKNLPEKNPQDTKIQFDANRYFYLTNPENFINQTNQSQPLCNKK